MKSQNIALDVDFIGGLGALTPLEEKALSEFFKQKKITTKKSVVSRKLSKTKRLKETS